MNNKLLIKRIDSRAVLPSKNREDVGYDIYAIIDEEIVVLPPNTGKLFRTGLVVAFPEDYGMFVCNRSGVGSKGLVYGAHVIDSGYRGEVFINLHNISKKIVIIADMGGANLVEEEMKKEVIKKITDGSLLIDICLNTDMVLDNITVIDKRKAVAQVAILKVEHLDVVEVDNEDDLPKSVRGKGALGDSGK
jgi:deoxyuridine 5'-triphosphate nucleotidohydrolase